MKISIVGAGNIGAILARKLAAAGHFVRLANSSGPESLREVAARTGATAATLRDATQGVDVVILSVPFGSHPLLRWLLSGLPQAVIVADTSNYFPDRDGPIAAVDGGQIESLWVSKQIGRSVIKAWNNALAATLAEKGRGPGMAGRIALSVAGDDPDGKTVIMALVRDTGFDAIDGGPLEESWRQQPITRAYCTELTAKELRTALATADRARAPRQRDAIRTEFALRGNRLTTDDMVRLHRAMGA